MSRAQQERELLAAARRVLDARGVHGAQMDEIARSAGISKGLAYRHFGSKDELHIGAIAVYLDELSELLEAVPQRDDPAEALLEVASVYLRYGMDHPAFLDCSLMLLRRPAAELIDHVSPGMLLRLTQAMARALRVVTTVVRRGCDAHVFELDDPDAWANYWYTRALGSLHLARIGVIVCGDDPPVPSLRAFDPDELERIALVDMLADVAVPDPGAVVDRWRARRGAELTDPNLPPASATTRDSLSA